MTYTTGIARYETSHSNSPLWDSSLEGILAAFTSVTQRTFTCTQVLWQNESKYIYVETLNKSMVDSCPMVAHDGPLMGYRTQNQVWILAIVPLVASPLRHTEDVLQD